MHPNAQTLHRFYTAFAQLDHATMAACYAPNATFDDEAFSLKGRDQIGGMWRMLCTASQKPGAAEHWKLAFSGIDADATGGKAHWEADYLFSATGRKVHNIVDGTFTFTPDGLIATHRDRFNFRSWSRQALGLPGALLGWSPSLKRKVRSTAAWNLKKFLGRGDGWCCGDADSAVFLDCGYRPGAVIGQRTPIEVVTWSVVAGAQQNSDHNVQLLLASSCIGVRDSMI